MRKLLEKQEEPHKEQSEVQAELVLAEKDRLDFHAARAAHEASAAAGPAEALERVVARAGSEDPVLTKLAEASGQAKSSLGKPTQEVLQPAADAKDVHAP